MLHTLEQTVHLHQKRLDELTKAVKHGLVSLHKKKDYANASKELDAAIHAAEEAWVDAAALKEARKVATDLRARVNLKAHSASEAHMARTPR